MIFLIGKRLSNLRKEKELTQEEFSALINISRSTYAQYEINRREPDYAILKRIADFYGVTTDYLLGRTDKKNFTKAQPSTKELEELLRTSNVQFDGAPLDDTDKEEVIDFLRYIWPKLQNKK